MTSKNARMMAVPLGLAAILILAFAFLDTDSASDEKEAVSLIISFLPHASSSRLSQKRVFKTAATQKLHPATSSGGINDQASADDEGVYTEVVTPLQVTAGTGSAPQNAQ